MNQAELKRLQACSTAELEKRLKNSQEFLKKFPQFEFGWHNEYRQQIKRLIAERIGRKTK